MGEILLHSITYIYISIESWNKINKKYPNLDMISMSRHALTCLVTKDFFDGYRLILESQEPIEFNNS